MLEVRRLGFHFFVRVVVLLVMLLNRLGWWTNVPLDILGPAAEDSHRPFEVALPDTPTAFFLLTRESARCRILRDGIRRWEHALRCFTAER